MGADAQALYGQALEALQEGDLDTARRLAAELKALRFTGAFEVGALVAIQDDDLQGAVEVLTEGVAKAPGVWLLWQLLGNVRSDLGNLDDAAEAYRQAGECEGADPQSLAFNLALLDLRRGDVGEALAALEELRGTEESGELAERVEDAWLTCIRERRGEELTGGTLYQAVLDAPLLPEFAPEDVDPDVPHRYVVNVHVAAARPQDVAGIVRQDLADEIPDAQLDELKELDREMDCLAGVYWISGRVIYGATDDEG